MAAAAGVTENLNKESEDGEKGEDQNEKSSANFECNICLDTAKDAVISMCGHLFW